MVVMEGGIFYRIRLSSNIELWLFCKLTVKMCMMYDGDDLLTLEIKARNKSSEGISCICWTGCGQIRYLVISINNQHLSSDQCDIDSTVPAAG